MEPIDYDVSVGKPARIDSGSRGKKISRVGKGVPDMYVAFRFWRKINFSRGHQRSCSRKSLDLSFLCSTYGEILKYISKALLFAWSRFCHTPRTN